MLATSNTDKCDIYSPINISEALSNGKCIDKCDYNIDYKNSSIPISNHGTYLKISYDNSDPPVKFHTDSYKVTEIRIYSPSLHTFNGIKTQGEMVVIHTSVNGGKQLFVCIPIKMNKPANPGSLMLSEIITSAAQLIPDKTNSMPTTIEHINNFNLNLFIPKKQFFYYEGENFLDLEQTCGSQIPIDVICYLPAVSNISVTLDIFSKLKKIIDDSGISPIDRTTDNSYLFPKLFINERGSSTLNSNDGGDVVMDCQPYETSEETVDVVVDTGNDNYDPKEIFQSAWFQVIAGSITFFLILCILNFIFGLLKNKSGSINGGSLSLSGGSIKSTLSRLKK